MKPIALRCKLFVAALFFTTLLISVPPALAADSLITWRLSGFSQGNVSFSGTIVYNFTHPGLSLYAITVVAVEPGFYDYSHTFTPGNSTCRFSPNALTITSNSVDLGPGSVLQLHPDTASGCFANPAAFSALASVTFDTQYCRVSPQARGEVVPGPASFSASHAEP
jgi:hypothetical protein